MGKIYSKDSEFASLKVVDKICKPNTEQKKPDQIYILGDSVIPLTQSIRTGQSNLY